MIQIPTSHLRGKSRRSEKPQTLISLLRGDIPEEDRTLILTSLHLDGRRGAEKTRMVTCHLFADLGPHRVQGCFLEEKQVWFLLMS